MPKIKTQFCRNFFLISCKKYSEFCSRDLDGEVLSTSEKRKMKLHYFFCTFCRRFAKQIKAIDASAKACFEGEQQSCCESLSAERKEKIKDILKSS